MDREMRGAHFAPSSASGLMTGFFDGVDSRSNALPGLAVYAENPPLRMKNAPSLAPYA